MTVLREKKSGGGQGAQEVHQAVACFAGMAGKRSPKSRYDWGEGESGNMGRITGLEEIGHVPPKVRQMYEAVIQLLEEGMDMEDIRVYLRGHNLFDLFYGKFRDQETELLKRYIDLAPREDFQDIFAALERFPYFESRRRKENDGISLFGDEAGSLRGQGRNSCQEMLVL